MLGKDVFWLGVSEDGGPAANGEAAVTDTWTYTGSQIFPNPRQITSCGVAYRAYRTGTEVQPFIATAGDTCAGHLTRDNHAGTEEEHHRAVGASSGDTEGRLDNRHLAFRELQVFVLLLAAIGSGCGRFRTGRPVAVRERVDSVGPSDVVGVVLDSASSEPVIGVQVLVQREAGSPPTGTDSSGIVAAGVADRAGRFALRKVPPGRYTLITRIPGYRRRAIPLQVTSTSGIAIVVALARVPCPERVLDCP